MLVEALRLPAPYVPGWFPLVVERLDPIVGPERGERSTTLLGSEMQLDTREYMQRRFFYHCYEAPVAAFLRRFLQPGDHVADVGAHVGIFTLLAARLVGALGRVYSFEPVPETFDRLTRNISINGYSWVAAERAAVSDLSGTVTLGIPEERLVGYSTSDFTLGATLNAIQAPAVTLDEFLDGEPSLRLLKIDAEGAEPQVLEGAAKILSERPPSAIVIEVNEKRLVEHGRVAGDVYEMLTSAGYTIHTLSRSGRTQPLPSSAQVAAAARRLHTHGEPRSKLRVGWVTRKTMFNAVALQKGRV